MEDQLIELQPYLYNFALKLTLNVQDAEDLTQDTLLRVLSNMHHFKDNSNYRGWVFTILRNTFINGYRRSQKTGKIMSFIPDMGNIEFLPADSDMLVKDMLKIVDTLSDKFKVPFKLNYEGYHYIEISEKLGIPIGTVKSRIFIARENIMRKLKKRV